MSIKKQDVFLAAVAALALVLASRQFLTKQEISPSGGEQVTLVVANAQITPVGDSDNRLIATDSSGPFIFTAEPTLDALKGAELIMFTVVEENDWGGAGKISVRTITKEESRLDPNEMSPMPEYSPEVQSALNLEAEFGTLFLNYSIAKNNYEIVNRHAVLDEIAKKAAELSREKMGGEELLQTLQPELRQLAGKYLVN